jgi:predicted RecA/RadA family phage recombinase
MKTFIQTGATIGLIAAYAVKSGEGMLVGSLFGVAAHDAASGDPVEATRVGVFSIKKKAATALAQGAKAYWDNTAREVTGTASGNTLIGAVLNAALDADGVVDVLLDGAVR